MRTHDVLAWGKVAKLFGSIWHMRACGKPSASAVSNARSDFSLAALRRLCTDEPKVESNSQVQNPTFIQICNACLAPLPKSNNSRSCAIHYNFFPELFYISRAYIQPMPTRPVLLTCSGLQSARNTHVEIVIIARAAV